MKTLNNYINEALIKKDTKININYKDALIKDITSNFEIYDFFNKKFADKIVENVLVKGLDYYEKHFKKEITSFTGPYKSSPDNSTFLLPDLKRKYLSLPKKPKFNGLQLIMLSSVDNIYLFGSEDILLFSSMYDSDDYTFSIIYKLD
jgi:hypothetical protein